MATIIADIVALLRSRQLGLNEPTTLTSLEIWQALPQYTHTEIIDALKLGDPNIVSLRENRDEAPIRYYASVAA